MPKNLIVSTVFPKTHPKAGQKTRFVEKIWLGFLQEGIFTKTEMYYWLSANDGNLWDISYIERKMELGAAPKIHTLRSGYSRKEGELFNPRIWSGKPYGSKQVQFAPTMVYAYVYPIEVTEYTISLNNGKEIQTRFSVNDIAENDGLSPQDFKNWFKKPFEGQMLGFSIHNNPYKT